MNTRHLIRKTKAMNRKPRKITTKVSRRSADGIRQPRGSIQVGALIENGTGKLDTKATKDFKRV